MFDGTGREMGSSRKEEWLGSPPSPFLISKMRRCPHSFISIMLQFFSVETPEELKAVFSEFSDIPGPSMLEIKARSS